MRTQAGISAPHFEPNIVVVIAAKCPLAKARIFPQNSSTLLKGLFMRLCLCSLLLITLLAFSASRADAHAIILESSPAASAIISPGPVPLTLRFNSRIDHARSVMTLIDGGKQQTRLSISPQSPRDELVATTTALVPGAYRIRWQVLSVDGHITRGDIPFTVQ